MGGLALSAVAPGHLKFHPQNSCFGVNNFQFLYNLEIILCQIVVIA